MPGPERSYRVGRSPTNKLGSQKLGHLDGNFDNVSLTAPQLLSCRARLLHVELFASSFLFYNFVCLVCLLVVDGVDIVLHVHC
jgi:hypothetical protein